MGATKTEQFLSKHVEIAVLSKALAHPARVAILQIMAESNQCMCGDLVDELPLAQPTVSQHLRELKQAGLIKSSVIGNTVKYCIDRGAFHEAVLKINHFFGEVLNDYSEITC